MSKTTTKGYDYAQLLLKRWLEGSLKPFRCVRCKAWALDPIGYESKGKWLCKDCADGVRPR